MAVQPVLAEGAGRRSTKIAPVEIQGQQRVLHALNRLTFGPRPGDVTKVEAMGLDAWFERQLNPAAIDDSALDARLAQFPAMQLSPAELARRYPEPQVIRAMANRGLPLPQDPELRATYADQVAFYKIQQAAKADKSAAAGDPAMQAGMDAGTAAPAGKKAGKKKKAADGADTAMVGDGMNAGGDMAASSMASDGMTADKPDTAAMTPAKPAAPPQPGPLAAAPVHRSDLFPLDKTQALLSQAPDQRMQSVLAMAPADLARFRQSLSQRELAALVEGMTPLQKERLMALGGSERVIGTEELQSRLLRDVYSDRQLEAVMTDFWLNHFNVYLRKNQQEPFQIVAYERDTIRPHALGKFEDLLVATAESPAMLNYLDNWRSIGPDSPAAMRARRVRELRPDAKLPQGGNEGLNENYGRELMELHTVGVNGGYTQADVTQVAKVFTGWTIDKPYQGTGGFVFEERRHEPGPKVVMGKTIAENGMNEGLEVLHMLASSPATARFLSTKLAVRFVSDTPPPALVDKMTQAYLSSGGDIKTVLRTMFKAPEFWSPESYRAKVKTPLEFVVSAARASDLEIANAQPLVQALDRLGMPLYGMVTPNGYSWKSEAWVNTGALVSRMNLALALSGGKVPGTRTAWSGMVDGAGQQAATTVAMTTSGTDPALAAKEKRLELLLLGEPVSDRTRATVLSQSSNATAVEQGAAAFDFRGGGGRYGGGFAGNRRDVAMPDDPQAALMAGLILGSPEFQRR
jgi:uncharacterized protein (DUF1800 family)